jgi:hypothetical protein
MAKKDKKKEPEIKQEKAEEPIEQQQAPKLILSLKLNQAPITVTLARFSQSYKKLAAEQFKAGITEKQATIKAGPFVLEAGKAYDLPTYLAMPLIKKNVVQVLRDRRKKP